MLEIKLVGWSKFLWEQSGPNPEYILGTYLTNNS